MAEPESEESRTDEFLAALVLHQVFLTRAAGGISRDVTLTLNRSERRIRDAIRNRLENAPGGLRNARELRRMQSLLRVVRTARGAAWAKAQAQIIEAMRDLAKYEPDFYARAISRISGQDILTPGASTTREILRARPFEGRLLREWVKHLEAEDIRRLEAAIRAGMVSGETPDVIVQRVVGRTALKGRDGVTQLTRNQVEALTRTAVTHVTSEVDREIASANRSLFTSEVWVSVLDSWTTPQCRALSGRTFEVGEGPYPPLHFRCRSKRAPVFRGDEEPRQPTYSEWLRRQPAAVQNEILGVTRGRLFRSGDLTLDRFINRNGDQIPLKDLARLESEAFAQAGIQI